MDMVVSLILFLESILSLVVLIKSTSVRGRALMLAALGLLLAFLVRTFLLPYVSQDYQQFLVYWVDYFKQKGGLPALCSTVGNYNIPYLTFLAAISYIDTIDPMLLIKLFSILFDIFLAYSAMKLVSLFNHSSKLLAFVFVAVLLLPTVIIDSAMWAQCDSIYVSFGIIGLFLALDDKPWLSVIAIAISFAFKLQAIFIMPVYAVLWFRGKFRWYHFLAFPVTYFIMMLPGILAGMPVSEALFLYTTQTGTIGNGYSYNAPSLLSVVAAGQTALAFLNTESIIPIVSKAAVIFAGACVVVVLLLALHYKDNLNDFDTVLLATLFCTLIPFLLPHMHERYFYFADILTLCLVFISGGKLQYFIAFILMESASLWCYYCYYRSITDLASYPVYLGAFAVVAVLCLLVCPFLSSGSPSRNREP